MSPTARTLAALRADGWIAAVVEKWNAHARRRIDLFGIGDILAIRPGEPVVMIQCTTAGNLAARRSKAIAEPRLRVWLATGSRFELWAWAKRGPRGKAKRWTVNREPVECAGLEGQRTAARGQQMAAAAEPHPSPNGAPQSTADDRGGRAIEVHGRCIEGAQKAQKGARENRTHEPYRVTTPTAAGPGNCSSIRQLGRALGRSHVALRAWLVHPAWPAHIERQPPWTPAQVEELRHWAAATLAPDRARCGYGHLQARRSQREILAGEVFRALGGVEDPSDETMAALSALLDDGAAEAAPTLDDHLAEIEKLIGTTRE